MKAESMRLLDEIQRLGARAVGEARAHNRRLGIPNVAVRDGRIVEELPDGSVRVVGDVTPHATETKRRAS